MNGKRIVSSTIAAVLMTVLVHTRVLLRRLTLQTKEGLTMDARKVVGLVVTTVLMIALLPLGALPRSVAGLWVK